MKASQVNLCITPSSYDSSSLSGFSERNDSSIKHGDDDLYISITWLKDESSKSIMIISVDALYLDSNLCNEIYEYIECGYAINSSQVIFNASHTHSAPSICDDIFGKEDMVHKEKVVQTIKEAIDSAFNNLKNVLVRSCRFSIPAGLLVNRRLYGRDIKSFFLKNKIIMAPNYENYADTQCRLLTLGKNTGILFNISCHPVFNTANNISSDFPGTIRRELLSNFKAAAFAQGFCGDIRPNSVSRRVSFSSPIIFFKTLINKVAFIPATLKFYNFFCKKISKEILLYSQKGSILQGNIRTQSFLIELRSDSGVVKKIIECKLSLIDKTLLFSIPAEVNSKYFQIVEKEFPNLIVIPMGYAENMIGYLPHWSEVEEGGYEVESYSNYGWDQKISIQSLQNMESELLSEIRSIQKEASIDLF